MSAKGGTTKLATLLAVMALAMFGLAACGGDDDSDQDGGSGSGGGSASTDTGGGGPAAGGGSTIQISADPDGSLAYEQSEVSAKAGEVVVDFTNEAPIPHDVVIEQDGAELAATDEITGSQTSTRANLKPGDYVFYCSVPGHREAGMEGELVVK